MKLLQLYSFFFCKKKAPAGAFFKIKFRPESVNLLNNRLCVAAGLQEQPLEDEAKNLKRVFAVCSEAP